MENFTEVNQHITPKKEIKSNLTNAFKNYKGNFLYKFNVEESCEQCINNSILKMISE